MSLYGEFLVFIIIYSCAGGYNDVGETTDEARKVFSYLVKQLDQLGIGYIQLSNSVFGSRNELDITELRPLIKNSLVFYNGNYNGEKAKQHLNNGDKSADAIVFGVILNSL